MVYGIYGPNFVLHGDSGYLGPESIVLKQTVFWYSGTGYITSLKKVLGDICPEMQLDDYCSATGPIRPIAAACGPSGLSRQWVRFALALRVQELKFFVLILPHWAPFFHTPLKGSCSKAPTQRHDGLRNLKAMAFVKPARTPSKPL